MAKDEQLFVERRPQGDYAVRRPTASEERRGRLPYSNRDAPGGAIGRARELNPDRDPLVERVRHTSKGKPDDWRKP